MRLNLRVAGLDKALVDTEERLARSVTAAMGDAAAALKDDLRGQVVAAGMGERLAKTWRGTVYPDGGAISLEAAAFVFSRAPKIIDAFDRGAPIKSRDGFWLAIPLPAAGVRGVSRAGKSVRITPGAWERRTGLRLRFVYRRGRFPLLVADGVRIDRRGLATPDRRAKTVKASAAIFVLVPQVTPGKRFDVRGAAEAQAARIPALIANRMR